jgi:outer membrane protein
VNNKNTLSEDGNMVKKIIAAALTLYVSAGLQAEDLMEVFQQALENDPQYLSEISQYKASIEAYKQARSGLLPQVDFIYSYSQTDDEITAEDAAGQLGDSPAKDTTGRAALSLTQSIYDYQVWTGLWQSEAQVSLADQVLEAAQQDVLLRTSEAYFGALAEYEELGTVRSRRKAVEAQYDLVSAKQNSGLARESDLYDAQARFLESQAVEFESINRFKDALQFLREVAGSLPATLTALGEVPLLSPEPLAANDWVNTAMARNPEVASRLQEKEVAQHEVKIQKGGHYPTLDLTVDVYDNQVDSDVFGVVETQGNRIALNLRLPIYSGGSTSSLVRESASLYARAADLLDLEQKAVQRKVLVSYNGVMADIAKVNALGKSVEAYAKGLEFKRVGYRAGITSNLTLLDAERDLFFAKSQYTRARYSYILNTLRLKRSAGLLSLADLEYVNSLLTSETLDVDVSASVFAANTNASL